MIALCGASGQGDFYNCVLTDTDEFCHHLFTETHPDQQFISMLNNYRRNGGLARADEVVRLGKHGAGLDVAKLARWIVERDVISFEWREETWLPLFQFDRPTMNIRHELKPVLNELQGVYSPCELAEWFARLNSSLHGWSPADVLSTDQAGNLFAVLQTARIDRFAAQG